MLKYYFLLLAFLFSFSLGGQTLNKLTNQKNLNFYEDYQIYTTGDDIYYLLKNLDRQIEVWDVNKNKLIYQTDINYCNDDFKDMIIVDNLIVSVYYDKIDIYDYVNKVQETKVYPHNFTLDKSKRVRLLLRDKILRFGYDSGLIYDFVLKDFFNNKYGVNFRSNLSYYYAKNQDGTQALMKEKFKDTITSKIEQFDDLKWKKWLGDKLYIQDSLGVLYHIDKSDVIKKIDSIPGYILDIVKVDEARISVLGTYNSKNYIRTLNIVENLLEDYHTSIEKYDFSNPYYASGKLFFTNRDSIFYYSFTDKSIKLLDTDFRKFKHLDKLLFSFPSLYSEKELKIINAITLEQKTIKLPKSEYCNNRLVESDDKVYFTYFKLDEGLKFYEYSFNTNTIKDTNFSTGKNIGLGYNRIGKFNKWVYVHDGNKYQILDESEEDNLDVLELDSKRIFWWPYFFNNKVYYAYQDSLCSMQDTFCVSLYSYNIKTNEEKLLVDGLLVPKKHRQYFKYMTIGRYLIVRFIPYGEKIMIDSETDEILDLPEKLNKLIFLFNLETANFYYTRFAYDGMYRITKDGKLDITKIGNHRIYTVAKFKDDKFAFTNKDTLFYCDGLNVKQIFEEDSITFVKAGISPDRRFMVQFYKKDGLNKYLVYDEEEDKIIADNTLEEIPDARYKFDLGNDNFYIQTDNADTSNIIYSYNWKTGLHSEKHFADTYTILSISDSEVHIYSNNKIYITDKDLNETDVINTLKIYDPVILGSVYKRFTPVKDIPSLFLRHLLIYDREERKFNTYFYCEDSLRLCQVILMDNRLYCNARNDNWGHQIYTIDLDNLSNTNILPPEFSENRLDFYPNPVLDIIRLKNSVSNYRIFDTAGNLVAYSDSYTDKIDISSFVPGIYFITSYSAKEVKTGKIIKLE